MRVPASRFGPFTCALFREVESGLRTRAPGAGVLCEVLEVLSDLPPPTLPPPPPTLPPADAFSLAGSVCTGVSGLGALGTLGGVAVVGGVARVGSLWWAGSLGWVYWAGYPGGCWWVVGVMPPPPPPRRISGCRLHPNGLCVRVSPILERLWTCAQLGQLTSFN